DRCQPAGTGKLCVAFVSRNRSVTPPRTRQASVRPSGLNAADRAWTFGAASTRGGPRRSHTSKGYEVPQAIRRSPPGAKASDQTAPREPGCFSTSMARPSHVHVPDDHGVVVAGGGRGGAVGGEGQAVDGADLPVVTGDLPQALRVEQADLAVAPAGGQ